MAIPPQSAWNGAFESLLYAQSGGAGRRRGRWQRARGDAQSLRIALLGGSIGAGTSNCVGRMSRRRYPPYVPGRDSAEGAALFRPTLAGC
ncbi:hypothetical protein ebA3462 [Aromatoleum aromaticum EbN1]|uniref:Uncharacterized protein n=1 Tax=Aromatoleum aromaticum (strain DSM 19018 / LMG 30748 / EbN1) TaxID=76114 RepID=Q5P3N4_AROAE|nr:hypothetical protein ebA3462 [Aromatoleum aromaticum EbN1]